MEWMARSADVAASGRPSARRRWWRAAVSERPRQRAAQFLGRHAGWLRQRQAGPAQRSKGAPAGMSCGGVAGRARRSCMERRGHSMRIEWPNLEEPHRIFTKSRRDGIYKGFAQWSVNIDFHESILVWHIATDVYIQESKAEHELKLVEATKVLSNYMMFLLVAKPDMLPGRAHNNLYLDICKFSERLWTDCLADDEGNSVMASPGSWNPYCILKELFHHEGPHCSRIQQREKLAEKLFISYKDTQALVQEGAATDPLLQPFRDSGDTCAVLFTKELLDLGRCDTLELIFGVWVEMMLYAADHCNRDSHARQLSNGGEFITIVWLLVHHRMYMARYNKFIDKLYSRHPGFANPDVSILMHQGIPWTYLLVLGFITASRATRLNFGILVRFALFKI
uniref:DUF4220 domain-containing protein n=1 Tax=Arundo donax TaxID=35708 RepID=A0A0A9CCN5_ARUDO